MSTTSPRWTRHIPPAARLAGFRRLLATRLAGQFGDGLFQASLAGAVLFRPESQPDAASIAAAFTVILLPYSLVGPLAGVLLDRWWRQRVLVWSNLVRVLLVAGVAGELFAGVSGVGFYASALAVISVNRFLLAALSASLPHVVPRSELVSANAVSTTAGATATAAGLGVGVGVAGLLGATEFMYAAIAASAAVPYLLGALAPRRFPLASLGPDAVERDHRETAGDVLRGLLAGGRHVTQRRPARRALAMIGAQRLCFGIGFVCTLLLFRNYLVADGFFRAGLAGLGQVVVAVAAGGFLAALLTPRATRRIGFVRWSAVLLAGSAVVQVGLGLPYRASSYVLGAFLLGFAAQGIKICVDTILQATIADDFRGRVFSLYDTLFNLTAVVAAVVTATFLPPDGHSPMIVVVLGAGYALTALVYLRRSRNGCVGDSAGSGEVDSAGSGEVASAGSGDGDRAGRDTPEVGPAAPAPEQPRPVVAAP